MSAYGCVYLCLLHALLRLRLISSRTYSDHDVNCNYIQDASLRCLCIPISLNLNYNNTFIINMIKFEQQIKQGNCNIIEKKNTVVIIVFYLKLKNLNEQTIYE
jgi:hypothetical protein